MSVQTSNQPRVESPCVRNCTLDDDDICLGCHRNLDEICAWGGADNAQRRQILQTAAARKRNRASG